MLDEGLIIINYNTPCCTRFETCIIWINVGIETDSHDSIQNIQLRLKLNLSKLIRVRDTILFYPVWQGNGTSLCDQVPHWRAAETWPPPPPLQHVPR